MFWPMHRNTSADDVLFDFKGVPFNIIAVDSGRVELIHVLCLHQTKESLDR
jgi:hypothetical protein